MPMTDEDRYPETWTAQCSREQADVLVLYDHHVVQIAGRAAVMLTYHWMTEDFENAEPPFLLRAVFRFVRGHPTAPTEVQAVIDQLTFNRES